MTARNAVPTRGQAVDTATLTDDEKAKIRGRRTPPRKWADRARTRLTAEYQVWADAQPTPEEQQEAWLATSDPFGGMHPVDGNANHAVYFPEDHDKDLGDGAWVLVVDPPITEQSARFMVPILSMWWARPHVLNTGATAGRLPYQGVIQTPAGDLHLWPHEYVVVSDAAGLIGCEGTEIHTLGGEPLIDVDMLFYMQARGISRTDAIAMLWSQIDQGDYAYVTFPPEAVDVFAGVNTRALGDVRDRYERGEYAVAGRTA